MRLKCHVKASSRETLGLPSLSVVKNPPASAGDFGLIPGLGRFPGEENGNPLQYSCLENPMDGGAWKAPVHGIAKSDTTELLTHNTQQGDERLYK